MIDRKRWRLVLGAAVLVAGVAAGCGFALYWAQPNPRRVTIHVSGAPDVTVSGAFEVDSIPGAAREARLPAQFDCTGHRVEFTVRRVGGPDRPIAAVVDLDGDRRGIGTSASGVRVSVWQGSDEPHFWAMPSEPEWKETEETSPPPDLIGVAPPEWTPVEWLNTKPLLLAKLRGQVVLVRWFTNPVCDHCVATAPALREFHERYRDRGLAVVGMYHHSDDTLEEVQKIVDGYGFLFPVGIDRGARTRRLWCLGRDDYGYTSVTFLLDREGAIRFIHPGGRYVRGDETYRELESQIEHWLDD